MAFIGHHINTTLGFISTADYAKSLDANFYQLFLSSPRRFSNKRHSDLELSELKSKLKEYNMKVVVHGNYQLNFCNPPSSTIHQKAVLELCKDLNDSIKLDALGVIIHMGKRLTMTEDEAIMNYVIGIKTVLAKTKDSVIILETGAGTGSEICTSIFKLGKLYRMFSEEEKNRLKFCIDTCHVFSAGYHLGDVDYVDIFDILIRDNLGWDKIACIHLNDSKYEVNSHTDRHADITKGNIKEEGLKKFVQLCSTKNIPIVLETPCEKINKKDQIAMVKQWISEI